MVYLTWKTTSLALVENGVKGAEEPGDHSSRCEMMVEGELEISRCRQMCPGMEHTGLASHILKAIYILHPPPYLASHSFSFSSQTSWLMPSLGLCLDLPCFRITHGTGPSGLETHALQESYWKKWERGMGLHTQL